MGANMTDKIAKPPQSETERADLGKGEAAVIDVEIPETLFETLDEDNRLTRDFVNRVLAAVERDDPQEARRLVEPLHEADIADLFELTSQDKRGDLALSLGELLSSDVLAEVNEFVREDIIDALPPALVAALTREMETDDAVSIIEDMEKDEQQAILAELDPEDRAAIEDALSYPEDSAGRIMQRDLIAVPQHMTVGQVIDYLRDNPKLTTEFWEIFVVDPSYKPIGTCRLSWILRSSRRIKIVNIMEEEQTLIPIDMDQEEVALRFQKYALISAAVVDGNGRLAGVITADDVVHIVAEEAGEDITKLSGAGDGDINEPIFDTVRVRLFWLLINLGTAIIASITVGLFESTISKYVVLAVLMPIVSGMGGNAGTQTMAVAVRAIATNQLTSSNTVRVVLREFRIAIANGLVLGLVMGGAVWWYYDNYDLGLVMAAAMVGNSLVAGLTGILIPVALDKADVDPAVSSAVFVTTFTDVMGFFLFLGLAAIWGV
jgi:magnesium transporter